MISRSAAVQRVLLVEDNLGDARLFREMLAESSQVQSRLSHVATVEEASRHLATDEVDVILLDLGLPDAQGMQGLHRLQAVAPQIVIVVLTGSDDIELADRALQAGAQDYIVKGQIEAQGLRRALRYAIDRRVAESAVRESESRYRQLIRDLSVAVYTVDLSGAITLYNRAAVELWGREPDLLHDHWTGAVRVETWDGAPIPFENHALARTVRDGQTSGPVNIKIQHPDGSYRFAIANPTLLYDARGDITGAINVVVDVTERVTSRLALVESEARYRKLIESSFDAIDISQGGLLVEVNSGFLELFGYDSAEEVIGKPLTDFCAAESRKLVEERWKQEIEGMCELVGLRRDGTTFTLEATARTHQVNGLPGRVRALRDITKRQGLEDQLRQSQKMDAMGRLAGGVSHDFNNLLTVIISYAEMLSSDLVKGDPRREDLGEILKASESASSLTRQLLAFSRQEVIQPRLVELRDAVASTRRMLQRVLGEDMTIASIVSPVPLPVSIDPGQLEHLLMNLAVNARDAMPTGGRLTIETTLLDVPTESANSQWPATAGRYAQLSVRDSGTGMEDAIKTRIFEPFFTTKGVGLGTGLGLATVYGIVTQNHGFIRVESELGAGTTFIICLPLEEAAAGIEGESQLDQQAPIGTETVLLVEDDAALRAAVRALLERLGYTVLAAGGYTAALEIAEQAETRLDLLLTDVVMPGVSGRELSEKMHVVRPEVKVLFMSGYTDDAVLRHGVRSSNVAFIQKPFTQMALAKKLREVLDG